MEPSPGALHPHLLAGLQGGVDALKARGVKVLVVVQRAPAWASGFGSGTAPPRDPSTFASFIRRVAQRVPGVDAWEIWNEPDEAEFWAGGADPARYAALLRAAYPAIKSVQPADVVVTGATTGNNFDFVEALYANGAGGHFDAVGVHTDTACLTNGPGRYYRDERGRIGRYTFTGYREVHAVMAAHGDAAKPIWMTELGWNTQSTRPGSCNTGAWAGQKRLGVSKQRQARLLRAAYRCLAGDPFVHVGFWFGMQDIPGARHAAGYGLFNRRGRGKPSAKAFKRLRRGIRPKRCGGYIDRTPPTMSVIRPRERPALRGQAVRARARVRQPRRHRAAADLHVAQRAPRADLGRQGRLDRAVVGVAGLAARRPHADVPRPRQRAERDLGDRYCREGPAALVQPLTVALQDPPARCR